MEREEGYLDEQTGSPRFGDEQSLRGAQPVVPLAEIQGSRTRGKFLLSLALLLAVGLGAGVALLLVQMKRSVSIQSSAQPESNSAPNSQDPAVATAGDEEEMMDLPATEEKKTQDQVSNRRMPRKRVARSRNSDSEVGKTEESDNDAGQKPILVDQWEEKRSRRVNKNGRSRVNAHRPDLFRIREIFEGPRP